MVLAVVLGLVTVAGGCSGSGDKQVEAAPSAAQAERAIRRDSRTNVETGPARFVSSCASAARTTTCVVDFEHHCGVLSVSMEGSRLVVRPARGRFACIHASGWMQRVEPIEIDP